jgi:hypothetical protein
MYQFYPYKTSQVSVGGTATQIVAANSSRSGLQIINTSTVDVYLGESGVTTSTGHLLVGTKGASVSFTTTQAVYGITSGSSETVTVLETF